MNTGWCHISGNGSFYFYIKNTDGFMGTLHRMNMMTGNFTWI